MKKIKAGLVGAGWMGSTLLKRLTERTDVEVRALFETNAVRGREILKSLGLAETLLVDRYEAIIANPEIDAVWLVSPNSYHAAQALAAIEAGKHVFCEKPMATDFHEYCALLQAEKAHPKLITFVDYIMRFDTMETRLKELVTRGKLGTLTQVQVNYRHPVNIAGDKVWKLKKDLMGDAIGMGIIHSLSTLVDLMSPQARPVGVYATSLEARVRGFEAAPIWNILVKFDNGSTGFCFGNIDSGNGYDAYHNLFGTEGALVFESQLDRPQKIRYWSTAATAGKWIYPLDPDRCRREGCADMAWPADTTTPDSGNVMEHQTGACVGHFIECIRSGTKSPLSFVNAAPITEIGWAAQMSAATDRTIPLPLDLKRAKAFFGSPSIGAKTP